MQIKDLSKKAVEIWGDQKTPVSKMIVVLGKVFGDICRWERNDQKDKHLHSEEELKKELGNLIFSSIRFCNELGYEPEECIELAIKAQEKYAKEN
jgi:hypothetical protein